MFQAFHRNGKTSLDSEIGGKDMNGVELLGRDDPINIEFVSHDLTKLHHIHSLQLAQRVDDGPRHALHEEPKRAASRSELRRGRDREGRGLGDVRNPQLEVLASKCEMRQGPTSQTCR